MAFERTIFAGNDALNSSIKTARAQLHQGGAQLQTKIYAQSPVVESRYMSTQTETNQNSAPIVIERAFLHWIDSKTAESTDQ